MVRNDFLFKRVLWVGAYPWEAQRGSAAAREPSLVWKDRPGPWV